MSDQAALKMRTPTTGHASSTHSAWITWAVRFIAVAGVMVVAWACVTGWGAVVHGHPLYVGLLALTLLVCAVAFGRTFRRRKSTPPWRRIIRVVFIVLAVGWIALMAWLRPFSALEPALAAMASTNTVTVTEDLTQIVMTPVGPARRAGVFFQPGAKVDARAYAAVLRPLAESGYTVVITKQPLGIAFLSITALDAAKPNFPTISRWIVGGHSLGGTVAAIEADAGGGDPEAPVVGLLLYASYPASDISASLSAEVLSISASADGLATPDTITASRETLPASTSFTVIDGAVHAFFGDYGPQPGDGTPTVSHDKARTEISRQSVAFLNSLSDTKEKQQ